MDSQLKVEWVLVLFHKVRTQVTLVSPLIVIISVFYTAFDFEKKQTAPGSRVAFFTLRSPIKCGLQQLTKANFKEIKYCFRVKTGAG